MFEKNKNEQTRGQGWSIFKKELHITRRSILLKFYVCNFPINKISSGSYRMFILSILVCSAKIWSQSEYLKWAKHIDKSEDITRKITIKIASPICSFIITKECKNLRYIFLGLTYYCHRCRNLVSVRMTCGYKELKFNVMSTLLRKQPKQTILDAIC